MNRFGSRLMLIGAVLLVATGGYVVVNLQTETELEIEQINIDIRNNGVELKMISEGQSAGDIEVRSAKQKYQERLRIAYWPAGFGLLFLLVGLAASAGNERQSPK